MTRPRDRRSGSPRDPRPRPRLARRGRSHGRGSGRGWDRRGDHRSAACGGGHARGAAGGRSGRARRDGPHHGQDLLSARAHLRAAAVALRRRGRACTAPPTRRPSHGSPVASSATGSTATSAGALLRLHVARLGTSKLEDEVAAAVEAGLPAKLVEETPLPYPVEAAVRFDAQAELHATRYLLGLLPALRAAGGEIYEGSRAHGVALRGARGQDGCRERGRRAGGGGHPHPSSTARWRSRACTPSAPTRSPAGSRGSRRPACTSARTRPRVPCALCR